MDNQVQQGNIIALHPYITPTAKVLHLQHKNIP